MNNDNNEIKNVIDQTLKNFTFLSDANSIIGTPVKTSGGATVIPVSKMTVAILSGGGQYGEIKLFQANKNYPLSTGGGGIVNVRPSGFLVEEKGELRFISTPDDYIEKLADQAFGLLNKIYEKI